MLKTCGKLCVKSVIFVHKCVENRVENICKTLKNVQICGNLKFGFAQVAKNVQKVQVVFPFNSTTFHTAKLATRNLLAERFCTIST